MGMVSLGEAKGYLRVDSGMDDSTILTLMDAAEKATADVARMGADEWELICDEGTEEMTIHGEDILPAEIGQMRGILKAAVLYALGYLYEHREEADHHSMMMTLRCLLSPIREGVF